MNNLLTANSLLLGSFVSGNWVSSNWISGSWAFSLLNLAIFLCLVLVFLKLIVGEFYSIHYIRGGSVVLKRADSSFFDKRIPPEKISLAGQRKVKRENRIRWI